MATRKTTTTKARDGIAATGRSTPVGAKAGPAGPVGTRKSVVTNPSGSKRSVKTSVVDAAIGTLDTPATKKAAVKPAAKKVAAKKTPATKKSTMDVKWVDKIAAKKAPATKIAAAKPAAKKEPTTLKFKGMVIPVGRVAGDDLEIPTVVVKNVADTVAFLAKMPRGATWKTDASAADASTIVIYNRSGALVADVRIEAKK